MGWKDTWNNFMQSNEAMGGPTSILDYGANQLANIQEVILFTQVIPVFTETEL